MRHSLPKAPQFYVTAPQECPYLDNKIERKLFTTLSGAESQLLNNALSKQGFRRSQNVLYRPSCSDCNSCLSARIPVSLFKHSRSQRRVLKRNKNLARKINTPWATEDQYQLFKDYVEARHKMGGMSGMDEIEFSSMIEETTVKTILCEYSYRSKKYNDVVAVSLTDVLDDGLSMVYSFYKPNLTSLSLGKYMILDHIDLAQEMSLTYLYLGYWVSGSKKMNYKSEFKPLEVYKNGDWSTLKTEGINSSDDCSILEPYTNEANTIYLPKNSD